ncbi:hypothetical protein M9H77_03924 [Catharanthus roseus]|uniref:Uncharacterized protein n=1 Tax=Catharanthus roseus TaxID=4058 RepID=A0ACC0CCP2_CATRO|nr:hypothetical protein M9H77_03924 [Catharanthus roseus]
MGGTTIRLTEEQLQQTEQFRKSHVLPRNILRFFQEQDVGCAVSAQKIYNVVAKIKKKGCKEETRDIDPETRNLTPILEEISTGSISKVREVRRLIKGVISPVLPDDPCAPPPFPPQPESQRDDRRRIQPKGKNLTGNTLERVDELIKKTCWEEGPAPYEHWLDAPDHIYVIANTFNFCVLQMRDRCPLPPIQVQWQYHRDVRVSGWAEPYYERIAEWVRRSRAMYPTQDPTHVVIP